MSNILLFVDDSATMQTVAEITFRHTDWEYVGVRTADEGRSAASEKSPTLILVDAVMPDGSGYDLAKELKAAHSEASVVMVCGNSEAYDAAKGEAAGCAGGIVKPWQTDKIVEQLKELSQSASSGAEANSEPAKPEAKPSPVIKTVKKAMSSAPRSATLMGMPALEMPPSKPLPAGVAAIAPKPTPTPKVKTPPPPIPTPAPPIPAIVKTVAKTPTPAPAVPVAVPSTAPAVESGPAAAAREPMIKATPGKPIRLVLASQAEAAATSASKDAGLNGAQASALNEVNREMLEKIIWEVVPDLAEAIIRENLETLTSKAR